MRRRTLAPVGALVLLALLGAPAPVAAKGSLSKVEDEFEKAIQKVTPATVVCLPWGVDPRKVPSGSSGVIMSRSGLVLSDGDVGIWYDFPAGKRPSPKNRKWADTIEIRMPNLKGRGFRSFKATVIKRDRDLDTTLMRMEKPPRTLKPLDPGHSDDLRVGDFTFAMGNSFGLAAEAPPTLTAGIVASLVPKGSGPGGAWQFIYTSAAVNPGVNGGPLVDIDGNLVGTVSSAVPLVGTGKPQHDPELAYAYLGKVVPVERLKAHYADLAEYAELFPASEPTERRREANHLATVFHHAGRKAFQALVSLEVKRKAQISLAEPAGRGLANIPRYLGPVSGVLVSADGFILTSLYNLCNVTTLVHRRLPPNVPDNMRVKNSLEGIEGITVYMPDARQVSGKVVAYHEGIGIAMIKADLSGGTTASAGYQTLVPAEPAHLRAGRFVLAVGNPFGVKRLEDPLLTVGMLSKRHAEETDFPWASQWQTDAGITDANSGGAAVDIRGHLLGILTIWSAAMHGRNSGIGFVIPWSQIAPCLEAMKGGHSFRRPMFGITWKRVAGQYTTILDTVGKDTAAEKAGLKPGDELTAIDGQDVATADDVRNLLRGRKWAGDKIKVGVRRAGEDLEVDVVLGARD